MINWLSKLIVSFHRWLIHEEALIAEVHIFKKLFVPHHANGYRPHATHHHTLAVLLTVLISFKIVILGTFLPMDNVYASGITASGLVEMTNEERARKHLPSLKVDPFLVEAARLKALDMFENQYWSHTSPDGVNPWYWFDEVGYMYEHAGENLARDFYSNDGVFDGWKNSREHYNNIINNKFEEIGIAVVPGIFDGKNTTIIVQLFGAKIDRFKTISRQPMDSSMLEKEDALDKPIIYEPKDGAYINKPDPEIKGKANNGVLVEILNDDMTIGKVPTDKDGSYTYRPPALEDGEHKIRAVSLREKKSSEFSDEVNIIVDTSSPIIDSESIEVSYIEKDSSYVFTLTVTVLDNPFKVEILSDNDVFSLINIEKSSWGGMLTFDKFINDNKNYEVTIYAVDKAGNSAVTDYSLTVLDKKIKQKINEKTNEEINIDRIEEKPDKEFHEALSEKLLKKMEETQTEPVVASTDNEGVTLESFTSSQSEEGVQSESQVVGFTQNNIDLGSDNEESINSYLDMIFYFKIFSIIITGLLFIAFLLQAYVIYHRANLNTERYHPIFHAISVLCIMVLIVIS